MFATLFIAILVFVLYKLTLETRRPRKKGESDPTLTSGMSDSSTSFPHDAGGT